MTRAVDDIMAELAHVSLAPVVDDGDVFTGVVTPARWKGRCRGTDMCRACYFCRQAIAIQRAAFIRPWDEGEAGVPREPPEHIFPCVEAALAALVRTWDVDRGTRSPLGPMLDRVRLQMGDQGGEGYQGGHRGSREHRSIEDLAEVDRAFRRAYRVHFDAGSVSEETCQKILVLALVGRSVPLHEPPKKGRPRAPWTFEWGREPMKRGEIAELLCLPEEQVGRVARAGRREMLVPLAAKGVIPWPKPQEGLHEDIQKLVERANKQRAKGPGRRTG